MCVPKRRAVLLIAFHFPPDTAPGALRAGRFFKYLPDFGFQLVVITAAESCPVPGVHVIPAPMRDVPDKRTLEGWGELVLRKWVFPTEMAIFWSVRAGRMARELHAIHNFAAVLSSSPPFNVHLAAMRLKAHCGVPWIADFRDALAGNPFRKHGTIPAIADRWLERRIFRRADALIGVTDHVVETWKAEYPQEDAKMHLLWNGYDPDEPLRAGPIPHRPYKVLLHIGTLYGPRHPAGVLHSLMRLVKSGRLCAGEIQIQLVGDVSDQIRNANTGLLNSLCASGLLKLEAAVPRPAALARMAEADFLLLLDLHGGPESPAVPAKLFEYIRVGRPILAFTTPQSPAERILASSAIRYIAIYPRDSEDQVDSKLLEFLNFPSDPTPPSESFRETFDGRRQVATLARLIEELSP